MGRARYRSIDDRARYWANFFFYYLTRFGKLNLENFQRKKTNIVLIRTHAHSFDGPVHLPLGYETPQQNFI